MASAIIDATFPTELPVNGPRRHPISTCLCAATLAPVEVVISRHILPTVELQLIASIVAVIVTIGFGLAVEVRLRTHFTKRVLILGTGATASMLIDEIESAPVPRYVVAGVADRAIPTGGPIADRWLGRFDQLADILAPVRPTHIVIASDNRRASLPLETLLHSRVRGVVVEDALDFYERLTGRIAIEALTPGRLVLSRGFRNGGASQGVARAMSVIAAIVGLIMVAPLLLIIAVAIKLDSCGPLLFKQRRTGRDGRCFLLLKFRTMRACDEPRSEWARDNQDRITRVGKWLRRFRLDEVPQLVNILRGEMNLIGPRPHPSCNARLFQERIAFYGLRSALLPGITGWAQVRYGYANTLEEETEKMRYDLYYIKNRSLWLDGQILLETIGFLLRGSASKTVRRQGGEPRLATSAKTKPASVNPMPVVAWSANGTPSIGQS